MRASRGLPDVSADASGHTGMALAISLGGGKTKRVAARRPPSRIAQEIVGTLC